MSVIGRSWVKLPGNSVVASFTGFVLKVDLHDLTDGFWNVVDSVGSFIRVRNKAGTDLPFDLISIDIGTKNGTLFFRTDLVAGQLTEFQIIVDDTLTEPLPTDPLGRNAVWADFDMMLVFEDLLNRAGGSATVLFDGTASAYAYTPTAVGSAVNVHQGVAWDGTHFYVTDNNLIKKYTAAWALVATQSNPIGAAGIAGADHCGDPTIQGGELFIPIEKYPNSPYNNQWVAVFDPATLAFIRKYDISAQAHETSSICWNPVDSRFYITDFTAAGYSKIHKYTASFVYDGFLTLASPIAAQQGIAYYDNALWLSVDAQRLYKVSLDGLTISIQWSGSISGYMEGLASKGDGTFYILFDGSPSAIYTFTPSASAGLPGWLNLTGSGNARVTGLPKRTSWTVGASVIPSQVSSNGAIMSYSPNLNDNTTRATLALRASLAYGIWNNTDSWLMALEAKLPLIGDRVRLHQTYDATVSRKIYQSGRLVNTDLGVVQRPAGAGDTMFIGAENTGFVERFRGSLNYAYLRNGELSADWIRMEEKAWERLTAYSTGEYKNGDIGFAGLNVNLGSNIKGDLGNTGWTLTNMQTYTISTRSTTLYPRFARRFFRGDTAADANGYQDIAVAEYAERIDNGDVSLDLVGAMSTDFNDADGGNFYFTFYDVGGQVIRRVDGAFDGMTASPGVWTDKTLQSAVPHGTRTIRVGMYALRYAGSDLGAAFAIQSLKLTAPEIRTAPTVTRRRQVVIG